ncbi:transposase [Tessaracoccus flavus]|uniref:transposase n=1 Tax=Tessaracoccus flavus TaxID=1610493 RepID=UPI001D03E80E|nr:transposase [Tessaracoccus flavus]
MLVLRRRIGRALCAVVMEADIDGLSTSAVDDLVVALGGTGSPNQRCLGSVPVSKRRSAGSGPGASNWPARLDLRPAHRLDRSDPTKFPGRCA